MSDYTDEELSVDFTDVEAAGGFDKLPNGRYLVQLVDWEMTEVKNAGGKLPIGTPGIKLEHDIVDGDYENRKIWTNFWLTASSLPYFKGYLLATGEYTEEELNGPLGSITEIGDRLVDAQIKLCAKVGVQKNNPEYNDVKSWMPASEYKGASGEAASSMMP